MNTPLALQTQIEKATAQRKRTLASTMTSALLSIINSTLTLSRIRSIRTEICQLRVQEHRNLCELGGPFCVSTHRELGRRLLQLESQITALLLEDTPQ